MIHITKKKLQLLFKKFTYNLFKFIYGNISEFENSKINNNTQIYSSLIEGNKYAVYLVNKPRLYTDTISDCAIIQNKKVLIGPSYQIRNTKFDTIENNIVFTKGTPRIKKSLKGNVLSLLTGGAGNFNYWHWLFDVLPRIKIFTNLKKLDEIDYFLFPNLSKKFQRETIDLLKIPLKKCISSLEFRHFECDQIISTDHPYVFNNDATSSIQNLPLWIIKWLNKSLTKNISLKDNNFPEKIYIDRADASPNVLLRRKILNEMDVKKTSIRKGYKVLQLSDYKFTDQMKLFFNAKKITGLHGAGFANVIFSHSKLKMLELKPSGAGKMCENLAKKCNVEYECISVEPKFHDENNQMGNIFINLDELAQKL